MEAADALLRQADLDGRAVACIDFGSMGQLGLIPDAPWLVRILRAALRRIRAVGVLLTGADSRFETASLPIRSFVCSLFSGGERAFCACGPPAAGAASLSVRISAHPSACFAAGRLLSPSYRTVHPCALLSFCPSWRSAP
jgi:hypothetical protein